MAVAPKPVALTQRAPIAGERDPEPLVVVGTIPATAVPLATAAAAGVVKRGVAVTNATVAADGTSAGTQLNALLAALRTAGVIAP